MITLIWSNWKGNYEDNGQDHGEQKNVKIISTHIIVKNASIYMFFLLLCNYYKQTIITKRTSITFSRCLSMPQNDPRSI